MDDISLEKIIKQYIQLQSPNPKGWQAVRCQVCNDHTRKGLRGAFLFDNNIVVYKCWNCGHLAKYDPLEHEHMSKNMIRVLDDFGVPSDEWQQVILSSPAYRDGGKKSETKKSEVTNIEPKEIKMPDFFYPLSSVPVDDELGKAAREYLTVERGIDPEAYPFMLAHKAINPKLHKWLGRLIMPIYKNNRLIYYIGRALYDATKKYETPATPKEKVIYGFDKLFEHTEAPLIIVEGWFDAFSIDGIATLGNVITPYQAQWLNRSRREKIYIPDTAGDGRRAAEQALDFGWSISTPDIGSNCKDMNDAVVKYGKMYVMQSIIKYKTKDKFEAETQLGHYCVS